jgi:hypothetical protein
MALSVASGTFTWRTTTGDTVISGLTDPKVIVLWTTGGQTAAGAVTNQSTRWSLGFGTFRGGAVQQNYVSNWMTDGNSTAIYGESLNTDAILRRMASDTTIDAEYDLTSMDSTSVTLNCPDASASAVIVHYLILGGDDITDAEAHQFALSTAAATQDVTLSSGMGNPGDGTGWLSLFAHGQRTATGTGGSDINFGFGAAKSSTERAAFTWGANDGSGNMNCVIWAIDRAIVGVGSNQGVNYEADLDTSGHPTDGYQLAFADQAEVAHLINAVAIRGNFQAQIGRQATRTSTGDQDIAQSFSEELRGCVFFGHSEPGSTSIITTGTSLGNVFVGATDLTTEGSAGFGDDDGLAFNNSALVTSTTQSVQCYGHTGTENSITNLYSADVAESSTNVRLTYTTANGTAREFAYLFLFDAPAAGQEFDITAATETDTALALTFTKTIVKTLGIAAETNEAQALSVQNPIEVTLTVTAETDAAQSLTLAKALALAAALETDSAQALTFTKTIVKALTAAAETDAAQALSFTKTIFVTLGVASETDAALTVSLGGPKSIQPGLETDAAIALTFTKTIFITIAPAAETNTAQTLSPAKVKTLGPATTVEVAQALGKSKNVLVLPAPETDEARQLAVPIQRVLVPALEGDEAVILDFDAGEAVTIFFGPPSPSGGIPGGTPGGGRGLGTPAGAMYAPGSPKQVLA